MKKSESCFQFSEVQLNDKNNLYCHSTGITQRLLDKYKSKKDFTVIGGKARDKKVNIAA